MMRQRKRPRTQGEKSRMIKARKDCIMKKVEELQGLTKLGACVIIPLPDGKYETWPKESDKLRELFNLYEENMKSQNENANRDKGSCSATDGLSMESFVGPSLHESNAGLEKEENQFLASDFGTPELVANEEISGKELILLEQNWCEMNGLSEACNRLDETYDMGTMNTTLDNCSTMFQPLQFGYPEENIGSVYDIGMPQPLQVCYPAPLPGFGSSCFVPAQVIGGNGNHQYYIPEGGKVLGEALGSTAYEDVNTTACGSWPWATMPQVFTQYHANHIGGADWNKGYHM